jgi:hypothetical protein
VTNELTSVNDGDLADPWSYLGHLPCQRETILLSRGMLEFKVFCLMRLELLVGHREELDLKKLKQALTSDTDRLQSRFPS